MSYSIYLPNIFATRKMRYMGFFFFRIQGREPSLLFMHSLVKKYPIDITDFKQWKKSYFKTDSIFKKH